jgi:hypothetical protein
MSNKSFISSSISTGEKQSNFAKNNLIGSAISQNSIYDVMKFILNSNVNQNTPTAGGTLTVNGLGLNNYDYVVKQGNITLSSFNAEEWFTNTEDSSAALIVVKGDLTINSGVTFQPHVRKLFTCLWVQGNLSVNGTLTMTARGASTASLANPNNTIRIINGTYSSITNPEVPSSGGSGGATFTSTSSGTPGNNGSDGFSGATGGGGSGGKYLSTQGSGGAGASGTAFSGGPGGGGANSGTATAGGANGGAGGRSDSIGGGNASGGGAGNPGGRSSRASSGNVTGIPALDGYFGTGGTLIVFVTGNLSGSGTISSNGSQGGGVTGSSIGGGGGSGAGSVNIICNSGSVTTLQANGGARGLGYETSSGGIYYSDGGRGGNGTARVLVGFTG